MKQQTIKTLFKVPKMDCPSEEQMIRMTLEALPIQSLNFDLQNRLLTVQHTTEPNIVLEKLMPLGYGAEIQSNSFSDTDDVELISEKEKNTLERNVLHWLLILNGVMFVVEIITGLLANSAGLLADALDMFADAAVYVVALYAVGKATEYKLKSARLASFVELALAFGAIGRVCYQVYNNAQPEADMMIWISILALMVNVSCLYLISKRRHDGAHMKASYIFSANDVIANIGVIIAGILVAWTASPIPDWIIGLLIAFLVLSGALRILKLK